MMQHPTRKIPKRTQDDTGSTMPERSGQGANKVLKRSRDDTAQCQLEASKVPATCEDAHSQGLKEPPYLAAGKGTSCEAHKPQLQPTTAEFDKLAALFSYLLTERSALKSRLFKL